MKGLVFLAVENGWAAGGVSDLKWPAVNFILLLGLFIWKFKDPLREKFDRNADDVASLFELAHKKSKESQIKLDMYQKKLASLNFERDKVMKRLARDVEGYTARLEKDRTDYVENLKKDLEGKIGHQRRELANAARVRVVDRVIEKSKRTVGSNRKLKDRVAGKLMAEI